MKTFLSNQIHQTCLFYQTLCKYPEHKYAKAITLFDVDTLGHSSMTRLTSKLPQNFDKKCYENYLNDP